MLVLFIALLTFFSSLIIHPYLLCRQQGCTIGGDEIVSKAVQSGGSISTLDKSGKDCDVEGCTPTEVVQGVSYFFVHMMCASSIMSLGLCHCVGKFNCLMGIVPLSWILTAFIHLFIHIGIAGEAGG